MDIEDPTNITGLASLVNKRYVNEKIDLDELEKTMMGVGGYQEIQERDPAQEFKDTLRELAGDDISVTDDVEEIEPEPEPTGRRSPPRRQPTTVSAPPPIYQRPIRVESDRPLSDDDVPRKQEPPHREPYKPQPPRSRTPPDIYETQPHRHKTGPPRPLVNTESNESHHTQQYGGNNHYIDDALRAYGGRATDIDVDRENEEDIKAVMLEDIDELMHELEQSGISLKNIPAVNDDSPLHLIGKVHKILRRKYDRKRCQGFGNEIILSAAQGMEYIFDGKRQFGPFKPDLTDWHNVARTKLHHMRYETSTIVSGIINDYNLGPIARLLLELVPSMILHNKMRKETAGQMQYNASQMSSALADMRDL